MILKHRVTLLFAIVVFAGCSGTPLSQDLDVRFEVRGLQAVAEEQETYTTFNQKATIVATGKDAKRTYNVVFRVKHISGGDPGSVPAGNRYTGVLVVDGVGDFTEFSGSRNKKTSYQEAETWQPEQVELVPLAYSVWREIPAAPVTR